MSSPTLSQIVKQKFGCHRGHNFDFHEQNSLNAIKSAIAQNPPFVEFDIVYQNGAIKTGHPPQRPLDKLEDVLKLFPNTKTYPKIDLKLPNDGSDFIFIDTVLKLISQADIPFVLISIGAAIKQGKKREIFIQAYQYIAEKIKDNPKIKLNLTPAKIKKTRNKPIDKRTKIHIQQLAESIYSLDLEIHEDDWTETAEVAEEYQISYIQFWLRSWPDVSHPQVNKSTIFKVLELEKHYPVKVYFDINPEYIVE
ncbi:hypothetical protein MYX07_05810, partial [Patescibacteria group bacterium AH-259-L07]|nr:hypothetical protein [Patescibacteria group bacterium AH-259-L07]